MDEDTNDVFYGTPLPPLEDDENASKRPELDLTVRDWKGRRRFHGAFTGGFSAGYFNTVGTEEGWIPSQFISRRNEKWDRNLLKSKPEDFMDEEDVSVFGIAPRRVHTKDDFKSDESFAGLRNPKASFGDVLKDIIRPCSQSIGYKLFRSMKAAKKYKNAISQEIKTYGCELPPNQEGIDSSYSEIPYTFYQLKNNVHGLGYQPLKSDITTHTEETAKPLIGIVDRKKLKISGEAFGYGALEEDDEIDAQVYSNEDMSDYDFAIGPVKQMIKPSISSTPGIIEGFVMSSSINFGTTDDKYPTIEIPKTWIAKPIFSKKRRSRWDKQTKYTDTIIDKECNSRNVPTLNANARAIILGEEIERITAIKSKVDKQSTDIYEEDKNVDSNVEKNENSNTEKLSRPLSAFFAAKFVKSADLVEETLSPGLTLIESIKPPEEIKGESIQLKTSIGIVNRETYQFHPHSLLCKRFNVPHPYPQYPDVVGVIMIGKKETKTEKVQIQKKKADIFSNLFLDPIPSTSTTLLSQSIKEKTEDFSTHDQTQARSKEKSTVNSEEKEKQNVENEQALERPSIDLFKAIFASDESSDENANNEMETIDNVLPESSKPDESNNKESSDFNQHKTSDLPIIKPSTSKGIFSDLDFDKLNEKIRSRSMLIDGKSDNDKMNNNNNHEGEYTNIQKSHSPNLEETEIRKKFKSIDSVSCTIPLSHDKNKSDIKKVKKSKQKKKHKYSKKKNKKEKKRKKKKKYSSNEKSDSQDSGTDEAFESCEMLIKNSRVNNRLDNKKSKKNKKHKSSKKKEKSKKKKKRKYSSESSEELDGKIVKLIKYAKYL